MIGGRGRGARARRRAGGGRRDARRGRRAAVPRRDRAQRQQGRRAHVLLDAGLHQSSVRPHVARPGRRLARARRRRGDVRDRHRRHVRGQGARGDAPRAARGRRRRRRATSPPPTSAASSASFTSRSPSCATRHDPDLTLRTPPPGRVDCSVLTPERLRGAAPEAVSPALPLRCGRATRCPSASCSTSRHAATHAVRSPATCAGSTGSGRDDPRPPDRSTGRAATTSAPGCRGGEIVVDGDVGAWAGAEMARRTCSRIGGDAGDRLGGAYPGARAGMSGGEIVITGDAGEEAGAGLRRGLVAIGGRAGEGAGLRMLAGTVIALGGFVGRGASAWATGAAARLGRGARAQPAALCVRDALPTAGAAAAAAPAARARPARRRRAVDRAVGALVGRHDRAGPRRDPDLRRGGEPVSRVHERTDRRAGRRGRRPTLRRPRRRSRRWTRARA